MTVHAQTPGCTRPAAASPTRAGAAPFATSQWPCRGEHRSVRPPCPSSLPPLRSAMPRRQTARCARSAASRTRRRTRAAAAAAARSHRPHSPHPPRHSPPPLARTRRRARATRRTRPRSPGWRPGRGQDTSLRPRRREGALARRTSPRTTAAARTSPMGRRSRPEARAEASTACGSNGRKMRSRSACLARTCRGHRAETRRPPE